ncbi:MAG: ectoine hydroxylase-related dioxygenase (phytanoyl-CoA dioxygenase family) [Arcticibacterium sp.]|jgi:ectoine hydroxylase-related dioxygenase (phytanoyl-CoA dioxygenase family)
MSKLREDFEREGYVIVDVLAKSEIDGFRQIMDEMLSENKKTEDKGEHSSSLQHLGDEISDFGNENRQYYFHLLTKPNTEKIHHAFHHEKVLSIVEELLGPDLIINNSSILASNPGVSYKLGWHRDIIQIPEEEIEDRLFSKERFHNSVQINLPLVQEDSLEIVPLSHNRPNTEAEAKAFAGTKHYAPKDANMPGAMKVSLKAGQAVFYNNNLIHRGYSAETKVPRRTLHMGYHSAKYPPTWHFYLLKGDLLTEDYLKTLSPRMRGMMEEYLECRKLYPNMADTWKEGYAVS